MTNIEKIKELEVEEFVDFLLDARSGCPDGQKMAYCQKPENYSCFKCWREWLSGDVK